MFCRQCGAENNAADRFCVQCGQGLDAGAGSPPPADAPPGRPMMNQGIGNVHLGPSPSYLATSIIVTVLCCMPFGIVAIVYSAKAMSENSAGNYEAAKSSSDTAKMWGWISFGSWLVASSLWLIVFFGMAASGMP